MFELSVALKYLIPRWRQLSVSIISMISILVIALVVWLILVFFSVTNGLEKIWVEKLISLTAPVRVVPTQEYYNSYYYLSDSISSEADYNLKTLGEKRELALSYDEEMDEAVPEHWTKPDLDRDGNVKDLVSLAFSKISEVPHVEAEDYEMTVGNLSLHSMSQAAYLGSFDPKNKSMHATNLPVTVDNLTHLYPMLTGEVENFFNFVTVKTLKTPERGWVIPHHILPKEGLLSVVVKDHSILIPKNALQGGSKLKMVGTEPYLIVENGESRHLDSNAIIMMEGNIPLNAELQKEDLSLIHHPLEAPFKVNFALQNMQFEGIVPYYGLQFGDAEIQTHFKNTPVQPPLWMHSVGDEQVLPKHAEFGTGVLLPKTFRDAKVNLGDRGYLSYYAPTTSTVQEMRVNVFVAGFYDPGIIPIGAKYVLTQKDITTLFRLSHNPNDTLLTNGINVRFNGLDKADSVKEAIEKGFNEAGIAPYWKVETYKEYDFTKDLIQQLHSEKNLFSLIATVIIIVACSNIISMLIILVNDKKLEIGILRSMGASSLSIAAIFGLCGTVMGLIGSIIGALVATLTLHNLSTLIGWISWAQGFEMLNPVFYGDVIPNELSSEALGFVLFSTVLISLLAGLVPAIKASMLRPSATLRAE